jgi:L-ascorbate metabolism protein UlaG (beta-lactamase superfamily)
MPSLSRRQTGRDRLSGVKITHLGHSCVLVESGGARILIDPGAFTKGFEELTDLDAVLVTHQHVDHLDVERLPLLLEANPQARLLTEAEAAAELDKVGIAADPLHVGDQVRFADAEVSGVGGVHAEIDPAIARIGNVGFLLRSSGEPTFFHPGDAYEATPNGVDVLALPLSAPWAKVSETTRFISAIRPGRLFPVHDGLLAPTGRAVYLRVVGSLLPEGSELQDLAGAKATDF